MLKDAVDEFSEFKTFMCHVAKLKITTGDVFLNKSYLPLHCLIREPGGHCHSQDPQKTAS